MERPVSAHSCGLESVKQIQLAAALQEGPTQARRGTSPNIGQGGGGGRTHNEEGINVTEKSGEKNDDVEEITEELC